MLFNMIETHVPNTTEAHVLNTIESLNFNMEHIF